MYYTQKSLFLVLPPSAVANNATLPCNVIDTLFSNYLEVIVLLGNLDVGLTTLKLQESDVKASATSLTGGVDISVANGWLAGSVFGTDPNDTGATSVLPSATDDNAIFKFELDLRGHKRYILPVVTVGNGPTGAYVSILAELSRGQRVPTTAAEKGCAQILRM